MIDTLSGALGLGAHEASFWIPLVLAILLFLTTAAAVVLDGFDIGVGCLLPFASPSLRLHMVSLLSPWRDANEFWLFLGLGLLLSAFPHAWGAIMGALYMPLSLLGVGVLLRSASFELRLRSPLEWQPAWVAAFAVGSWLTAASHGFILARVVTAYAHGLPYTALAVFFSVCALAAYSLLGATWLIMRQAGELRARAVMWARRTVRWVAAGGVAVSLVLGVLNTGVLLKWGNTSGWFPVVALWSVLLASFVFLEMLLQRMVNHSPPITVLPFILTVLILLLLLSGLAYSFFPYLILDDITVWDAVVSTPALRLVLFAAAVVVSVALVFNIWVYWGMFGASRPTQPPPFSGFG